MDGIYKETKSDDRRAHSLQSGQNQLLTEPHS